MSNASPRLVELKTIASFPDGYFLENLVMRRDRSILVTVLKQGELWYVPPVDGVLPVEPTRLQEFSQNSLGICEIRPDVFLIATCNFYGKPECYLRRLDLNEWTPGAPVEAKTVFKFPEEARGLNGICSLTSNILLVADSFSERIWRVDIDSTGGSRRAPG